MNTERYTLQIRNIRNYLEGPDQVQSKTVGYLVYAIDSMETFISAINIYKDEVERLRNAISKEHGDASL